MACTNEAATKAYANDMIMNVNEFGLKNDEIDFSQSFDCFTQLFYVF